MLQVEICSGYLDDVIIYSKSDSEHFRHVKQVLSVLRYAGNLLLHMRYSSDSSWVSINGKYQTCPGRAVEQ